MSADCLLKPQGHLEHLIRWICRTLQYPIILKNESGISQKCRLTNVNNLLCSSGLKQRPFVTPLCFVFFHCFPSLSPSVYYRKARSETLPTPPPVVETEVEQPSDQPPHPSPSTEQPPHPSPSTEQPGPITLPQGDNHAMETEEPIHDPAAECLDPSMIKDLDFDIPLMFTDDDLGLADEKPEVVEEGEIKLELGFYVT